MKQIRLMSLGETGDRFLFHTLYLYVTGMCLEELKDKYDELGN